MLKQINLDRMIQSFRHIFTQYIRNLILKIAALMDEKKLMIMYFSHFFKRCQNGNQVEDPTNY